MMKTDATVGYIIMVTKVGGRKVYEDSTLSYGVDGEPDPELLLRRGRATLFELYDDALAALGKSCSADNPWPQHSCFEIVEVRQ